MADETANTETETGTGTQQLRDSSGNPLYDENGKPLTCETVPETGPADPVAEDATE